MCVTLEMYDEYDAPYKLADDQPLRKGGTPMKLKTAIKAKKTAKKATKRTTTVKRSL